MSEARPFDVAIVGGGFTGAAVAYHLSRYRPGTSLAVLEPRSFLGGGLAYDDQDPAHRINVPASRMSLIPGDDTHFARWLAETQAGRGDEAIVGRDGALYPRRAVFGRYVAAHIEPLISAGHVAHIRDRVEAISFSSGRWTLTAGDGTTVRAGIVVLATTHPSPDLPQPLASIASDRRVIADALVPDVLDHIAPHERVVILGTGLTMADVVASLDRRGHRGPIVAISRRGLRSRGHPEIAPEPAGDFTRPPAYASGFLHQIRQTVRKAAESGTSWHAVIDAVRAQAQTFWPTLSPDMQSRIVRHLRVYWDVHRFRIAPQVEDVLDRKLTDGSLTILAASLLDAQADQDALTLSVRRRARHEIETLSANRIIVTTGPAHAKVLLAQAYLRSLKAAGHVKADHLGLGIACDGDSRAIGSNGGIVPTLFIAGPLARARFGELMGLPQVSEHARRVAETVSNALFTAAARDVAEVD